MAGSSLTPHSGSADTHAYASPHGSPMIPCTYANTIDATPAVTNPPVPADSHSGAKPACSSFSSTSLSTSPPSPPPPPPPPRHPPRHRPHSSDNPHALHDQRRQQARTKSSFPAQRRPRFPRSRPTRPPTPRFELVHRVYVIVLVRE
ncbi:hypothetical protein DFJ73DRAFT_784877 [Zopfochytrium polystomum]|nr:hypothetical protein DFJ73DRAFT_784877 [Zopfochytrium polystomum]